MTCIYVGTIKDLNVSDIFIVNIILYTILLRRYDRIISDNYSDKPSVEQTLFVWYVHSWKSLVIAFFFGTSWGEHGSTSGCFQIHSHIYDYSPLQLWMVGAVFHKLYSFWIISSVCSVLLNCKESFQPSCMAPLPICIDLTTLVVGECCPNPLHHLFSPPCYFLPHPVTFLPVFLWEPVQQTGLLSFPLDFAGGFPP